MNLYDLHSDPEQLIKFDIDRIQIYSAVVDAVNELERIVNDPDFDDPNALRYELDAALSPYYKTITVTRRELDIKQFYLEEKLLELGDIHESKRICSPQHR